MREANAIAGNLGRDLRSTRRRRRLTQAQLADQVGISQAALSALEAGRGAHTSIETWVCIGIALERPIAMGFSRDVIVPLMDSGHLDAQELTVRLARSGRWRAAFEAPDDPRSPTGSTDLRLLRGTDLVLVEIWNRLDDLGAAARSSDRKLAVVRAGTPEERVNSCWLLVDTAANRTIIRRYPGLFRSRFTGSSAGWVEAITNGGPTPTAPGIAWIDLKSARLLELRLAAG